MSCKKEQKTEKKSLHKNKSFEAFFKLADPFLLLIALVGFRNFRCFSSHSYVSTDYEEERKGRISRSSKTMPAGKQEHIPFVVSFQLFEKR